MNITSNEIMIFSKEYKGKTYYRAGLSTKKQDGSYEKGYIDIKLPKGVELANQTKIKITKGFLSFYKNKDKKDVFYIVIQEYTTGEQPKQETTSSDPYSDFGNSIKAEELDNGMELPF